MVLVIIVRKLMMVFQVSLVVEFKGQPFFIYARIEFI